MRVKFGAGAIAFAIACGGNASDSPETGVPDDSGVMDEPVDMDTGDPDTGVPYPAMFPAPPQVITSGGPTAPLGNVFPVFWSNHPMQSQIQQYLKPIAPSTDW